MANVMVEAFHSQTASSMSSRRLREAADLSLRWVSVRGALFEIFEMVRRLREEGRRSEFVKGIFLCPLLQIFLY